MFHDPYVKITHLPSGISARADGLRSQKRMYERAKQMFRSKLWAIAQNYGPSNTLIRSYELPQDQELLDGKIDIGPRRKMNE